MAVSGDDPDVTPVRDVRRRVAFRAFGAVRLLEGVQGALEDVEGACDEGQFGVAAYQARVAVLHCLWIRSLARAAEVQFDAASPSFDFFAGLSDDEIAEGLTLAHDAAAACDVASCEWLERLRAYITDTEGLLGYGEPLPVLRAPEGPLGMMALTRRWGPLLEELGLPPLLQFPAGSVT